MLSHTAIKQSHIPLIPVMDESFFQSMDRYYHTLQSMTQIIKALKRFTYISEVNQTAPLMGEEEDN